MNKDALLATVIGFFLGLVITSAVLYGGKVMAFLPQMRFPNLSSFTQKDTAKSTATIPVTEKASSTAVTGFSVSSPLPEDIVSSKKLTVLGTAYPQSKIILTGPNDETVVQSEANNSFSGELTLSEGKNTITVISVLPNSMEEKIMDVYFTEETL